MDVAVTGSSGLIGTALAARLRDGGHRVLRLVRDAGSSGDTAHWDPARGTIDAGALEGIDAVVHLAGAPIADARWTAERKAAIRDSRTQGTDLIARTLAAAAAPPSVLLSGSAIGFYGDTGDRATDETAPAGRDFLSGVVVDWEAAAAPAVDAGVRTAFLRTGIVLDARGGALAKQLPFFKVGLGGKSGSGRQYQSWISLDDEVRAIEWLLTTEVSGPVNLTAPNPVTNAEFARTLGHALHRPTTIIPMIGPRLLFGRELADTLLLTSQRIVPTVLTDHGFAFTHERLDDALADILERS